MTLQELVSVKILDAVVKSGSVEQVGRMLAVLTSNNYVKPYSRIMKAAVSVHLARYCVRRVTGYFVE